MKIIAVIVIILLAAVIFFVVRNINYDYSGEKFLKNQAPKAWNYRKTISIR